MKRNRVFIFMAYMVLSCLAAIGCGNTQPAQAKVESGVIDKEYSGNVSPALPQDYKVGEEAKEGMIKVTIKCGVEKEIPIDGSPSEEGKSGDSDEAKPKI